VDEDANNLGAWLTINEVGNNRFWISGDGAARSMASEGEPTTINFLNNVLGVRFTCDTIRLATCPTGSVLDSTFCLPLANVAGADFASVLPVNARGNGCPNIRSFDLITNNTSIPTARGQLTDQKLDGVKSFASITNHNTIDVDYETVVDGVGVGWLRDPHGSTHNAALCDITTPAVARSMNVIGWFATNQPLSICRPPRPIAVEDTTGLGPPIPLRTRLVNVYPNPMNPTTRIRFTTGRGGEPTRLAIHDVTGRLVRTLVDAPQAWGTHEVTWDGRDDEGRAMGSGMYFVRLAGRGTVESKKIVVAK
jgi:hypothetical protein